MNFKMIEKLRAMNHQKIQDGILADLQYDRNEIMETLGKGFPNARTNIGDITRQDGILFIKCGQGGLVL